MGGDLPRSENERNEKKLGGGWKVEGICEVDDEKNALV